MYKLLKAGFFRLKKDVIFWLFIFLTIGITIFTLTNYSPLDGDILDDFINEFVMYIGIFIAIFVSIFVGKEYSEGIIRNKIIVGHSRVSIYFSNLLLSIITSVLCEFIFLAIILLVGIPIYGNLRMPLSDFFMSLLNVVLVIISFCSIFNFIAMICSEITVSTTICILLFIAMFIAQGSFALTANSNKYIEHTFIDENGNRYIISQEPDPNYPGDNVVKAARIIYLSIPQGQANELADADTEYLYQMPIYSITLICIINIVGVYIFSKKELK